MDWGKAFTYVFDDKDWVTKILIGGILSLIPVVNLVVLGYALKVLKNVANGAEQPLPGWDDFGDYFVKGLVSFLGAVVWALPVIIMGMLTAMFSIMTGYETSSNQVGPFVACIWGLNCLSGLYGLFLCIVLPAACTKYAIHNEFGDFFRFGEIFKYIGSNLGNYIIALLLAWIAQFIAGFGVILCFIGVIFTAFWAILVGGHLFGQVYRVSTTPITPVTPTPEPTA